MEYYFMVAICNLTNSKIPERSLRTLAENVLKRERNSSDVSVVIVGPTKMRQLNRAFRNKEHASNVLSFPGEGGELGEVVLCPSVIGKDAVQYGITFIEAMRWMLVHGLLHLLGYTHNTMKKKEQRYLSLK